MLQRPDLHILCILMMTIPQLVAVAAIMQFNLGPRRMDASCNGGALMRNALVELLRAGHVLRQHSQQPGSGLTDMAQAFPLVAYHNEPDLFREADLPLKLVPAELMWDPYKIGRAHV